MPLPYFFGFKMLPGSGRDHGSREHVFHTFGPRTRRGLIAGVFAIDPRHSAPQDLELCWNIHGRQYAGFASSSPLYKQWLAIVNGVIKSAIVPVAGIGTRLLPATKSQPKEMLPVARKPIVQYVVEELVRNHIEQILFITGRNKASIENHLDHDPELVRTLTAANKTELLGEIGFEELQAHFFYTRQPLQRGLG